MSYIPDCRTDGYYNEKYLNSRDKEFVKGFDWCVDVVLKSFMANLDIYTSDLETKGVDINVVTYFENHEDVAQKFSECLQNYAEMERDVLITSMIDSMEVNEYKEIRKNIKQKVNSSDK